MELVVLSSPLTPPNSASGSPLPTQTLPTTTTDGLSDIDFVVVLFFGIVGPLTLGALVVAFILCGWFCNQHVLKRYRPLKQSDSMTSVDKSSEL